jgi:L-amino acid N-acyltransferase YncA
MSVSIREARREDAATIAAIHNIGIAERSATFETEPRSEQQVVARIEQGARFPLLVAVDDGSGDVVGWAGVTEYRPRACYAGIGEFSIYLAPEARGRGVGRVLMEALVDAARARGYWKLLSRVFLFNAASRALCRSCGFREVGIYEKHARLDGAWLDVVIVERLIGP